MIYFITAKLHKFEEDVLHKLMDIIKVPDYQICNIDGVHLPTLEELKNNNTILVYDETKTKSSFEKKLDDVYPDFKFAVENFIRISKPNTIISNEDIRSEDWAKIKEYIKVTKKTIYMDLIPSTLPEELKSLLKGDKQNKIYTLSANDSSTIEIHPDNMSSSKDQSLTYSEFVVLVSVKALFRFSKMEIQS